jgi:hypothetical protein
MFMLYNLIYMFEARVTCLEIETQKLECELNATKLKRTQFMKLLLAGQLQKSRKRNC